MRVVEVAPAAKQEFATHRVRRTGRRLLPYLMTMPGLLFTAIMVIVPLSIMLRMSFYARTSLRIFDPGTFSFDNYLSFLTNAYLLQTTGATLTYAFLITVLSLIMGYPVAYFLARTRSRWRPVLFAIVVMPFMVSLVVSAYGWLLLLGLNGPVNWLLVKLPFVADPVRMANTPFGGVIAMTVNHIPYQVLPLVSTLSAINRDLEDASSSLGANPVQTFLKVTLPLSVPGILGGSSLVLILALTAFVAPRMVGGPQMTMLGVEVYDNMITYLNWPQAAAIGFVLTIITILFYLLVARLLRLQHLERERLTR